MCTHSVSPLCRTDAIKSERRDIHPARDSWVSHPDERGGSLGHFLPLGPWAKWKPGPRFPSPPPSHTPPFPVPALTRNWLRGLSSGNPMLLPRVGSTMLPTARGIRGVVDRGVTSPGEG